MNEKMQKVKTRLLELGYQDNKYLDDYIELLEQNLDTPRITGSTQAHHVLPIREFKEDVKAFRSRGDNYHWQITVNTAELDKDNFRIHLLYKDHLKAHNLLNLSKNLDEVQKHYEDTYTKKHPNRYSMDSIPKIRMPKYITEEKILEKIAYYTTLYEQAKDERTAHGYRCSISQWKAKHKLFLLNPDQYTCENKKSTVYIPNEQCHVNAKKKYELKQVIEAARKAYKELQLQYDKTDPLVVQAKAAWHAAVAEYKNFCSECVAYKNKLMLD